MSVRTCKHGGTMVRFQWGIIQCLVRYCRFEALLRRRICHSLWRCKMQARGGRCNAFAVHLDCARVKVAWLRENGIMRRERESRITRPLQILAGDRSQKHCWNIFQQLLYRDTADLLNSQVRVRLQHGESQP